MIRALWFFIRLGVLIAVAVWLVEHPGAVDIEWQGYVVETSVGVLIAAAAVLVVAGVALYRLYRGALAAPKRIAAALSGRRRERGYRALTRGMVAVAAGDPAIARRMARRADGLLDEPPLTMLLSAQAAQLNGDDDAARRYFTAMLARPETAFLGLRGLLTQSLRGGKRADALEYARQAHALQPRTPWLLATLFDLEARAGHWERAESALRQAVDEGAIKPEDGRHYRAVLFIEESLKAERDGCGDEALNLASSAFDLLPGFVPAAARLVRLRLDAGERRRAQKTLARAWSLMPHPGLTALYRDVSGPADPLERLRQIQKLAQHAPGHIESVLATADAAMDAKLWGEARGLLQQGLALQPSRRVFEALARLERGEHEDELAARAWLAQGASAPADPAWTCRACGAVAESWAGRCPSCGGFDTLDWKTPSLVLALAQSQPDGLPTVIEANR